MDENKRDNIPGEANNEGLELDNQEQDATLATENAEDVVKEVEKGALEEPEDKDAVKAPVTISTSMPEEKVDMSVKTQKPKESPAKNKSSENRGEQKQSQSKFSAWFRDIKAEFHKIIWPNKKELAKMTLTVIVTSLIFGLFIAGLDIAFNSGVGLLIDLFKVSA